MVGSRTWTAMVGLVASLVVSVGLWFVFDTLLVFLFLPFVLSCSVAVVYFWIPANHLPRRVASVGTGRLATITNIVQGTGISWSDRSGEVRCASPQTTGDPVIRDRNPRGRSWPTSGPTVAPCGAGSAWSVAHVPAVPSDRHAESEFRGLG